MTHPVFSEASVYEVFQGSRGSESVFKTGTFGCSVRTFTCQRSPFGEVGLFRYFSENALSQSIHSL